MTPIQFERLLKKASALTAQITKKKAWIAEKQKVLDAIKLQIAEHAAAVASLQGGTIAVATKATEGGGTSFNFAPVQEGGLGVRVTQPAAKLLSAMTGEVVYKLVELCGEHFEELFEARYFCVQNFRLRAYEVLPDRETAAAVIKLVEEPSKATVTIK